MELVPNLRVHINPGHPSTLLPQKPLPSCRQAAGFDPAAPPLPPVRNRSPAELRRPQLLSSLPFASSLHGAPPGHHLLFFPSPDRRVRAHPKPTAARSNSGEQSPEVKKTPECTTSPPGLPRHADHRGKIRASCKFLDRRKRSMPCRRRRAPPHAVTLAPAGPYPLDLDR